MTQVLADRYELGALLGTGGMARVYEAHDRLLDRRIAVKLLRDDIAEGQGRQSVLSEARAAGSFSHPHAVAVYDIGRDVDRPFIVMELVEGCSLAELLVRRGQLTAERAVAVAGQTLSALEAAHQRGLVHRDIKPANILLPGCRVPETMDAEGGVKLADFGIAKGIREAAGDLTLAGKVIGTPTYLSPEQVGGHGATPRSDLYSVGVVLYEMLAGHPPFSSETPVGMALAHQQQEPARLTKYRRDLPAGLVELVHRALRKDPYDRYPSAADMRESLQHWRGGAEAVAPTLVERPAAMAPGPATDTDDDSPVMSSGKSSSMTGWRPAVTIGALALVAVLLIALAGALGSDDTPADETAAEASPGEAQATEEVVEPEVTEPPVDEEPDGEPQDEGGGLSLPSLPGVSLPDPSNVGAEQLRDVVGRLPVPVVGDRKDDLQSGLNEVVEAPAEERPAEAGDLLSDVRGWVDGGELNEQIGQFVEIVLDRLAGG